MAKTISVRIASVEDALELAETMESRGLHARVAGCADGIEVHVKRGRREDTEVLLFRVLGSVGEWLRRRAPYPVAVRVDDRLYRLSGRVAPVEQ